MARRLHCGHRFNAIGNAMTPPLPSGHVPPDDIPPDVLSALVNLLRSTRFGSIEIVVHEGRVTQIERREKLRLTQPR